MSAQSPTSRPLWRPASSRLFWVTLLMSLVYPAYRYPLQINYSGTSPTYSDTPVALQMGKYLILLILAGVCLLVGRRIAIRRGWAFVPVCALVLVLYPVATFIIDRDSRHLVPPFLVAVSFVCVGVTPRITMTQMSTFMRALLVFSVSVNAIQVLLFMTIGRLPALAYEDSFSVRFGSFLDDPNGFGNLALMLLGYAYVRARTWKDVLWLLGVLASLLLTQSLTAILFLLPLGLLAMLTMLPKRPLTVAAIVTSLAVLGLAYGAELLSFYEDFYALKSASIDGHLSWLDLGRVSGVTHWLLGAGEYGPSESWWLGSIHNYGVVWTAGLLALCLCFLWQIARHYVRLRTLEDRAVMAGIGLFAMHFVVASINLPFFTVFPNNMVFFMLFFLLMSGKLEVPGPPVGARSVATDR